LVHPFDPAAIDIHYPHGISRKMARDGIGDELDGNAVVLKSVIERLKTPHA